MACNPRHLLVCVALFSGIIATGVHAADYGRERIRTRTPPATSFIYHSGGYAPLPPGNVLVGSIEWTASEPVSWSPFSTIGYYDDDALCTIRGVAGAYGFAPHFERLCPVR